jgi:hypothetical protein
VAKKRGQWWPLANTVMNFRSSVSCSNYRFLKNYFAALLQNILLNWFDLCPINNNLLCVILRNTETCIYCAV